MHRFYSVANPRSSGQLQSLSHYRDQELLRKQNPGDGAVDADGSLLEYEALELRLHPPNVCDAPRGPCIWGLSPQMRQGQQAPATPSCCHAVPAGAHRQ